MPPILGEALDGAQDGATFLIVSPGDVLSIKWLVENSPTKNVIIGMTGGSRA